ncbi:hypothetical protein [Streptomyces sp. NPDC008139]|uniref:hypothetical protein n=1 Tax=Streptomyces sp. NPDC008139 TaxID=3364814 RepID=UPI0036E8D71E
MRLSRRPLVAPTALALTGAGTLLAAPPGGAAPPTAAPGRAHAPAPRVAATPPMGWSSWSFLRSKPTEHNIEAQALAMRDSGLAAHGYRYINIDAGWSDHLDAYGRDAWNTDRFPNGLPAVAGYQHRLGLKFGVYLTPGIPKAAVDANLPIKGTAYHSPTSRTPPGPATRTTTPGGSTSASPARSSTSRGTPTSSRPGASTTSSRQCRFGAADRPDPVCRPEPGLLSGRGQAGTTSRLTSRASVSRPPDTASAT